MDVSTDTKTSFEKMLQPISVKRRDDEEQRRGYRNNRGVIVLRMDSRRGEPCDYVLAMWEFIRM